MNAVLRNNQIKYQLLEAMDIPVWVKPLPSICSKHNVLGAHCLVLLPYNPATLILSEQKILEGMLKVLSLDSENLHLAWVKELTASLSQHFTQMLLQYVPHTVLLMGETLARSVLENSIATFEMLRETPQKRESVAELPIRVTYDPVVLSKEPSSKGKAYKDLLNLKALLAKLGIK